MDLNNVTFNPNQKLEASAKDAAAGIRLLAVAFLASAVLPALSFFAVAVETSGNSVMALFSIPLALLVIGAGAYGAYLAASSLGWSGFITAAVVLCAIIPYLKLVCFAVLIAFSIRLIRKAGYRVSLIGPLRKRAVA